MAMNTEESLKEYLSLQLKLPLIARIGPLARTFDFVATAAPGVKEILTVGKLTWEVREDNYDLVVVDAPATGHIVGQLRAPEAIRELVSVGLVRDQTEWMTELLTDASRTGVVIVASPELSSFSSGVSSSSRTVSELVFQILTAAPPESGSSLSAQKNPLYTGYEGSPASNSTHTPVPVSGKL